MWTPIPSRASGRLRLAPLLLCSAALTLVACGAREQISRGDALLGRGKFNEAIAAYEEALRISPDNPDAEEGIKRARREAVRDELRQAKELLNKGEYAESLVHGLRARRMPLDLDEVTLARDIDDTIAQASRRAEETVESWSQSGLFVLAVELADQVVKASPGVESRMRWANEVRDKAVAHFQSLAADLQANGMPGSAAMQLAMARRVGAEIGPGEVTKLWDRFTEPLCFDEPNIEVDAGKDAELMEAIRAVAGKQLGELRARCGEGTRPLGVKVTLADVEVVDNTETTQAAKALPGSSVETTEVYYEEKPYMVDEEVTEYEKRIEKQEKRDCAPRPGKPRGCSTWVEDVEVEVPVKKMVTVQKIKRIKKTRPAKGPFPPDEVVLYEVTSITRRIKGKGTITIEGSALEARTFDIDLESLDVSNPEVRHPKMLVRANPSMVKSMEELRAEAATAVAGELERAFRDAVAEWSRSDGEEARKRVLEGKLPQAEELYLGLIALGATDDESLKRFFKDRYGKPVGVVMDYLLAGLGLTVERRRPGDVEEIGGFPRRGSGEDALVTEDVVVRPTRADGTEPPPGDDTPRKPDVSAIAKDELDALEEASLGDSPPPAPAGQAAPGETATPEGKAAPPGETAPEGDAAPDGEAGAVPAPRGPVPVQVR